MSDMLLLHSEKNSYSSLDIDRFNIDPEHTVIMESAHKRSLEPKAIDYRPFHSSKQHKRQFASPSMNT